MPGSRISTRFCRCLVAGLPGCIGKVYTRKDVEILTA